MKKVLLVGAFLTFCVCYSSLAQESNPRAAKASARQAAQHTRINQGIKSGELTKKEAKVLKVQQRDINRTKKRAKADGQVTREEKRKINRKQNRANRNIKRQKSDAQSRGVV